MADQHDDDPPRGTPLPPEVARAFLAQATDALIDEACRYAAARVPMVRGAGRATPHFYHRELVNDALGDTWAGTVTWDPAKVPLVDHVCQLVKTRTIREVRRSRRLPHDSIEATTDPAWKRKLERSLVIASQGDISPILLAGLVQRVVGGLRRLASKDSEAREMLGCWEDGVVERDEVMARTGWDEATYQATRKRLLRLVEELPARLRQIANDILRSAS